MSLPLVASAATAAAPPAAVDQYLPAPPGTPDDLPNKDRPGSGIHEGTTGGGGGGSTAGVAQPSDSGVAGGNDGRSGQSGESSNAGQSEGRDTASERPPAADTTGPSLGGYPLTTGIVFALAALAVAILAALALRVWRRYRDGVAIAGPE